MKTATQLAAIKRTRRLLRADPEHFAKLAAKGKGKPAPGRARVINKEASALGGRSRGKGMQHQQRQKRSKELEQKLRDQKNEEANKIRNKEKLLVMRKQTKNWKQEMEKWDVQEKEPDLETWD